MHIVTVRQPWASLIAVGEKTVENRPWSSTYRGDIAVHAGLTDDVVAMSSPDVVEAMAEHSLSPLDLPRGHVVAVAALYDVHAAEDRGRCCAPWGQADRQHLLLRDVRPLRHPCPATGQLGLRGIARELEDTIRACL